MEEAGNNRPICTLPALHRVFSALLYNRLYPRPDRGQEFRRLFLTLDHLATYKISEQRCREWGIKMWIATRHDKAQSIVGRARTIRCRTTSHQPLQEAICRPESDSLDRHRERCLRDKEECEAGRSAEQLAAQHGSAGCTERLGTMARERHGHQSG